MSRIVFNLYFFSKYRTEFMGFATILIIMCHAVPNGVYLPHYIMKVMELGQGGVQLFMFLSGIGLYFSLTNGRNKTTMNKWFLKRFIRLFAPYILILGPTLAVQLQQGCISLSQFFFRLTTIGFWMGDGCAWFVATLVPFYLIAPTLCKFLTRYQHRYIAFITLFCVPIILETLMPVTVNASLVNIMQVVSVFPSFIFGIFTAPYVFSKQAVTLQNAFVISVGVIGVFFAIYGLTGVKQYWLFFLLFLCFICKLLENKIISTMLSFFGVISLESYLLNISLPVIFIGEGNSYYFFIFIIGTFLGVIIHQFVKRYILSISF